MNAGVLAPGNGEHDPLILALARFVEALDHRYPEGPKQMRREALDARVNIRQLRKTGKDKTK